MMKLKDFESLGLDITWTLIHIGFLGSEMFRGELIVGDILEYAVQKLEVDTNVDLVSELVNVNAEDTYEIDSYLQALSRREEANYERELEKWKVCYVYQHTRTKNPNYITGLCELGDIWIKIGGTENSPHIFQGVNNTITPQEYYTQKNYDKLFEAHLQWIGDKVKELEK